MPDHIPAPCHIELKLPEDFNEHDLKKAVSEAITSEVVTALRNAQPTEKVTLITHKQFPKHPSGPIKK